MKISLFTKTYIPLLLLIIIILCSYGYINLKDQEKSYLKIMEAQVHSALKTNIFLNTEYILADDKAQLISNSLEFLKDNDIIRYIVYDKNSDFKLFISKKSFDILDDFDKTYKELYNEEEKYKILKANLYNEEVFHYVYKIKISKLEWGWMHVGVSLDEYYKQIEKIYYNFFYITFITILIAIVFSYILIKWLTIPIVDLSEKVSKISKGEFEKIDSKFITKDEIGQLKKDFNTMVQYLKYSKEQEKYIFHQSKMTQMSELLNNIAHQWRQPLSVISAGVSGMKLKKEFGELNDDDFDKSYNIMMDNIKYLTKTIDIFGKYTKNDTKIESIYINQLINDLVLLNHDILNKNFIKMSLFLLKDDININIHSNSLSQVIMNLILNSFNAFEKKEINDREISINIEHIDNKILIHISDNAQGIPEDVIDKIFEPYFTTKHQAIGVGMGLFLTYDIVKNILKGDIKVENIKHGAKFTLSIPVNIK
jgi:nitrogen fixation/metabolism regulation signal transduction histidine kinase